MDQGSRRPSGRVRARRSGGIPAGSVHPGREVKNTVYLLSPVQDLPFLKLQAYLLLLKPPLQYLKQQAWR